MERHIHHSALVHWMRFLGMPIQRIQKDDPEIRDTRRDAIESRFQAVGVFAIRREMDSARSVTDRSCLFVIVTHKCPVINQTETIGYRFVDHKFGNCCL
jgi:hypothetical protein